MIGLLFSKVGQKLLAFGALVLGVLVLVGSIFRAGKQSARSEALATSLSNVEKANEAKRNADLAARSGNVADGVRKFYIDK